MKVRRCAPAIVLALGMLVAPSVAAAKPSLSVTVLSSSQDKVLSGKKVDVSVYSKTKGAVRVSAKGAGSKTLTFAKGGKQRASLTLSGGGRRVFATCDGHRVTVTAKREKTTASGSALLTIDTG